MPYVSLILIVLEILYFMTRISQQFFYQIRYKYSLFQSYIHQQSSMEDLIEINGSLYEGGGQMIRSSVALSIITNKEFRIHSIRANRPNPGINNQLRSVFAAFTEKVPKVGETEVYMYPKFLAPKCIQANTAASCTLMMQCLVPVLTGINYDQQMKIIGGTDVSKSPCLQSIREGLIPLLKQIGINFSFKDVKKGYYPIGKGEVTIKVQKGEFIKPLVKKQLGLPRKVIITYYIKDKKPPNSHKQFSKTIKKLLKQTFPQQNLEIQFDIKAEKVFNTKDQYGIGCMIIGQNLLWDVGTVGQKITQQEILERLQKYCEIKPILDEHHQDQLLIYLSLALGKSQLLIGPQQSLHTQSLIYVINSFLPDVKFQHNQETGILSIQGTGYKRKQL